MLNRVEEIHFSLSPPFIKKSKIGLNIPKNAPLISSKDGLLDYSLYLREGGQTDSVLS